MLAEFAVLAPIALLAVVIARRAGLRKGGAETLLVVVASCVAAIGYLTAAELAVRLSPAGRLAPAIVLVAPVLVAEVIAGVNRLEVMAALVVVAVVAALCAVDAAVGRVLLSPDSYSILANASLFRDGVSPTMGALSEVMKRGVTIPVLNGLMPRDGLLSALAPGLTLLLAGAVLGVVAALRERIADMRAALAVAISLLAALLLVPQFQVNFFYLNSHTLVAVAAVAVVGLSLAWSELDAGKVGLLAGIGLALTLARAEGFLILAVLVLAIAAQGDVRRTVLIRVVAPSLVATAVWNAYLAVQFAGSHRPLVIVAFDGAVALSFLVVAGPQASRFRGRVLEVFAVCVTAAVIVLGALHPRLFATGLYNCAANTYRFWTPFSLVLIAVAGYAAFLQRGQRAARHVGLATLSLGMTMAFAKIFDGGLGSGSPLCRPGWGDTLNRSLIHLIGLLVVSAVLAVTEQRDTGTPAC